MGCGGLEGQGELAPSQSGLEGCEGASEERIYNVQLSSRCVGSFACSQGV